MCVVTAILLDNLEDFFTMAERQWLVLHELESIKVQCYDFRLPGLPKVKLQLGTSLCKFIVLY